MQTKNSSLAHCKGVTRYGCATERNMKDFQRDRERNDDVWQNKTNPRVKKGLFIKMPFK